MPMPRYTVTLWEDRDTWLAKTFEVDEHSAVQKAIEWNRENPGRTVTVTDQEAKKSLLKISGGMLQ